jgi:hypothetical protein
LDGNEFTIPFPIILRCGSGVLYKVKPPVGCSSAEAESGADARALQNLSEHRPLTLNAQRLGARARQRRFGLETSVAARFEDFNRTPRVAISLFSVLAQNEFPPTMTIRAQS